MNNEKKQNYRSHKRAILTRNIFVYILLVLISIIWLVPFIYLVAQSFCSVYVGTYFFPYLNLDIAKDMLAGEVAAGRILPGDIRPETFPIFTLENYADLFGGLTSNPSAFANTYPFYRWYFNTFIIALITCILQTVLVLGTSYAFSRLRFSMRKGLMKLILILGMFPGFLSLVIIYYTLKLIGLQGNIFSLILIYIAGSAMQYYIAKGFFDTIPRSLDEAAMIDGANKNTIFFRIIMPLAKPIVVYTLLLSFNAPWGDFMMGRFISGGEMQQMTVAVGLQTWLTKGQIETNFPRFCAGGVIVSIPIMALFFVLQKYYVEGITGGAVKG